MSVRASDRLESSMEFVTTARDLYKFTRSICVNKLSKRYIFYGNKDIYDTAERIFNNVIKANATNLENYYEKRTTYLDDALSEIALLNAKLSILIELVNCNEYESKLTKDKASNKLSDKDWNKWGVLLDKLERLINGVKKKDKERIAKLLNK